MCPSEAVRQEWKHIYQIGALGGHEKPTEIERIVGY
jgi:hypothetical protein